MPSTIPAEELRPEGHHATGLYRGLDGVLPTLDAVGHLLEKLREAHFRELQTLRSEIHQLKAAPVERVDASNGNVDELHNSKLHSDVNMMARARAQKSGDSPAPAVAVDETSEASISTTLSDKDRAHMSIRSTFAPGNVGKEFAGTLRKQFKKIHTSARYSITSWFVRDAPEPKTSTCLGFVESVAGSPWFEIMCSLVIVLNGLVIAIEGQCVGSDIGARLDYNGATSWCPDWLFSVFQTIDSVLSVLFMCELAMKLISARLKFFFSTWNIVDSILLLLWVLSYMGEFQAFNGDTVRVARLSRVVRLCRLVKVAKSIQALDAMFLMTTAIKRSLSALAWAAALLFVVQFMCGLALQQILAEFYFTDESQPEEKRLEMYEYFGTFTRVMLTMFEVTLANWPTACRLLAENVSEWFMLLAVLHKLIIGFAVLGIINGIFMQETFKAAAADDRIMIRQRHNALRTHTDKMNRFFHKADHSEDGFLDRAEFMNALSEPVVRLWLASMEIDPTDADRLFDLIDKDGNGLISIEEFIIGASVMKGAAKSVDVNYLIRQMHHLMAVVSTIKIGEQTAVPQANLPSVVDNDEGARFPVAVCCPSIEPPSVRFPLCRCVEAFLEVPDERAWTMRQASDSAADKSRMFHSAELRATGPGGEQVLQKAASLPSAWKVHELGGPYSPGQLVKV